MKILEEPHQDPQRSLRRSLKILKDLKKIFTRADSTSIMNRFAVF